MHSYVSTQTQQAVSWRPQEGMYKDSGGAVGFVNNCYFISSHYEIPANPPQMMDKCDTVFKKGPFFN